MNGSWQKFHTFFGGFGAELRNVAFDEPSFPEEEEVGKDVDDDD